MKDPTVKPPTILREILLQCAEARFSSYEELAGEALQAKLLSELFALLVDIGQPPKTLPRDCDNQVLGIHRTRKVSAEFERWTTKHGFDTQFKVQLLWLIAKIGVNRPKNARPLKPKRPRAVADEIRLALSQKHVFSSQWKDKLNQLPGRLEEYATFVEIQSSVNAQRFSKVAFRYFYRDMLVTILVDKIRERSTRVPWELLENILTAFGWKMKSGSLKKIHQREMRRRSLEVPTS